MPSTYLTRTQSSSPTNDKIGTMSFWIKRGNISSDHAWVSQIVVPGTDKVMHFSFDNSDDNFKIYQYESSATTIRVSTTRRFRDVSGWYHIVVAFDTTQSTSTDRIKVYVNGVQETSFSDTTYPSQNENIFLTKGTTYNLGGYITTAYSAYSSASLSHFHMIDGTAYDASAFGETDSTTGEWKIKTSPSVTYGTNGFFILKDGNTITDSSTNSNNFSLGGGTLTKTEDCPSNVFATLNALAISSYNTLSQGNLTVAGTTGANDGKTYSTLVMPNATSKFYWEVKCVANVDTANPKYGFIQASRGFNTSNGTTGIGGTINPSYDVMVRPDGKLLVNDDTSGVIIGTWGAGDILSFALDNINGAFYVGINGVWQTSGNPASGASRTGAIKTWSPTQGGSIGALDGQAVCLNNYNTGSVSNANFGNGYFGTTAVSSAGTNASGIGIFEYDVPTGYTALSTKGLNL